jgi:lysophospholipase L1-like esterase
MDKRWLYAGLLLMAGVGVIKLSTGPRLRPGLRVLLIGDSLAVGMAPHFQALAKEGKVQFESLALSGSRIDQWAQSAKLQEKLKAFRPELVLISLGTNDEYMQGADIVARQRAYLEQLLAKFQQYTLDGDGAPEWVVWIGPPSLPKVSNGIVAMIRDGAGGLLPRYYYYPSDRLEIPRGPDKIHPTARGYAGWAGAIWHWLS